MSPSLDPQLKRALADRIRYYNELGIFDFYGGFSGARLLSKFSPKSENHCPEPKPQSHFLRRSW